MIDRQYEDGVLTEGERHNKVIDIWTQTSNAVAQELITRLETESRTRELNPVYAMLDSGARGSKEQIKQLAGMRGLMAKPSGDIIERPIISNFREGLTVAEYFISTHGARKGLADTALKTADSGYMTRRLVDVAQDVICREEDCGTRNGIWVSPIVEGDETIMPLRDRILGRCSAQDVRDPAFDDGRLIIQAGQEFTPAIADVLDARGIQKVLIRSTLTCKTAHGVCVKCYGRNLASDRMAKIGDALGIIAAQSIGEPGTQLTMRTFHIGGTASSAFKQPVINVRHGGKIKYFNVRTVKNEDGDTVVVNKNGYVIVYDEAKALASEKIARERAKVEAEAIGTVYNQNYDYAGDALREAELDRYELETGAVLECPDGAVVKENTPIVRWDAYNVPIIAERDGKVVLRDLIAGVTLGVQKRGASEEPMVMEHRDDLHPQVVLTDADGEFLVSYPLPAGALLMVKSGAKVKAGMTIARVPRSSAKNKDITGGLPRIAELFEARMPKDVAEIARIDGEITEDVINRNRRRLVIVDKESGQVEEHNNIPSNRHLTVSKGDMVRKGQKLTEGSVVPQALLEVCGAQELQRYLVNEIQMVYRAQGVEINDKHIEIIIRQMMQKIRVKDSGDSDYLPGEQIDRFAFEAVNKALRADGKKPATGDPILLGITKASLETESFISAASFQDTTRILTEAATLGKVDTLEGFKENVITGHLIPAGTGTELMQSLKLKYLGTEIEPEVPDVFAEESAPAAASDADDADVFADMDDDDDFEGMFDDTDSIFGDDDSPFTAEPVLDEDFADLSITGEYDDEE